MFLTVALPAIAVLAALTVASWLLFKLGELVEQKRTDRAARREPLLTAIYTLENLLETPISDKGWCHMVDSIYGRGTLPLDVERSQLDTREGVKALIIDLTKELGRRSRMPHKSYAYQGSLPLEAARAA